MSRHTLTFADELFAGNAYHPGAYRGKRGLPVTLVHQADLGVPVATDGAGLAAAQAGTANTPLSLAATALDVPRGVSITSAGDDSAITFTVAGQDQYGQPMTEIIPGANTGKAVGVKAFARITSITPSAATAATVTAGWTPVLGLPVRVGGAYDVLAVYADDTLIGAPVIVAGATDGAGDVRGTLEPSPTPDGARHYRAWLKPYGMATRTAAYGVAQV